MIQSAVIVEFQVVVFILKFQLHFLDFQIIL